MADLHRHLEGSIRPTTAHEMSMRGREPGESRSRESWRSPFVASDREGDLLPYLVKIDNATRFACELGDWRRITQEAIADAADDGLSAVELRFSPEFISRFTGLDPDAVIEVIAETVADAHVPVEVGLIGIILRNAGPDSAVRQMQRLVRHSRHLVGVDLAGDEAGYPAALFRDAFKLAHERDLPVTIHAGEAAGPESVWEALQQLGPSRIGHGVRSAEDPRLMEHLADRGITLEVAITSNVQTGAAPSEGEHQVVALSEAGVPVALSTDNPAVSNTRLSWEYAIAGRLLDDLAVGRIKRQSVAARFA